MKEYERRQIYSDSELETPIRIIRSAMEGQYLGYPNILLR